ncbi:hypothetical protein BN1723_007998 [Verticillium longisporum]|uniref:Uncharacterized protein n=1 Tax=Verticillium longisporum TaxID=100787 RepID=A0A0G4NQ05_VERLO|nr:hypothetical protein BN1723_007998 [Verticillium longisporum]
MTAEGWKATDAFKTLHVFQQKPAPDPFAYGMEAIIQSYPPLGQVTQVQRGLISFSVILEVPQARQEESWQVSLWQSSDAADWVETPTSLVPPETAPTALGSSTEGVARLFFNTVIDAQASLQFTLKFRHGENEPWRWTRDEFGLNDGHVIVNTSSVRSLPGNLEDHIKGLNPAWQVEFLTSQAPRTRLWSLQAPVPASKDDRSSVLDLSIGIPWGQPLRWFALVRTWKPWLAPRHGKSRFHLDKDAMLCSFLGSQGKHLVLLAISGLNNVAAMFQSRDDEGLVHVQARNDDIHEQQAIILAAIGDNFESANASVMYQARNVLNARATKDDQEAEIKALEKDIKPEWRENWYDGLGYCTWNGIGQNLTEHKILEALDHLASVNVHITSLIIDDNWQSIDRQGNGQFQYSWLEFEADSEAFPNGLKSTISQIREKHPRIQHIAVWHALLGYWAGISPNGKLAKDYKTLQVLREESERRELPLGGSMTVIAKGDVNRFYNDFYAFLVSCGIDGVKTDAQFMMDTWKSSEARRDLIEEYLDAWTISTLRHFSIKAISCMSQVPQIMFHSYLQRNKPPILCRTSDDFFPHVPSSHAWHVWTNAHNALLTQHLNVLPDWDMFQTMGDFSRFHAMARSVSGGPIYITDVPGQHDRALIEQLTGPTPRNKTVIFRPSVVGKTIDAYNDYHDDVLLKIGSYHGAAVTGTSIVGVFNISSRRLAEIIPLSCFPGVLSSMKYIIRSHTGLGISSPISPSSPSSNVTISLPHGPEGSDILCAYPLTDFASENNGTVYTANLGLVRKFSGAAAIVNSDFELDHTGKVQLQTRLKALGTLGIYISNLPKLTIDDDFIATIQGHIIKAEAVSVSKYHPQLLEIDVEGAWHDLQLKPGWSNEVEIKMTFRIDHYEE